MKKFMILLTALQILMQVKVYSYEDKADCINTLIGPQSDPELIDMICNSATFESPTTKNEKELEHEMVILEKELSQGKENVNKLDAQWERIRNHQMKIKQDEEKEKREAEEAEKAMRKREAIRTRRRWEKERRDLNCNVKKREGNLTGAQCYPLRHVNEW